MLGDKAREIYDEQHAEYAKTHPDVDSPGAKEFLAQMGTHLDRFVEELSNGFQDLSAKGREVVARTRQDQAPASPEATVEAPTNPSPPQAPNPIRASGQPMCSPPGTPGARENAKSSPS